MVPTRSTQESSEEGLMIKWGCLACMFGFHTWHRVGTVHLLSFTISRHDCRRCRLIKITHQWANIVRWRDYHKTVEDASRVLDKSEIGFLIGDMARHELGLLPFTFKS
jgi:hypothetical protein